MAAMAVTRRMPSSEPCYTLLHPNTDLSSEAPWLPRAATFRGLRLEIEQEEIHV